MKLLVFVCVVAYVQCAKLPEYLKPFTCRKSNPQFAECLKKSLDEAKPYFLNGIKELSMPPMDPFELPFMTVNRTLNELVSIKAVMKNIKVIGAKDAIVEHIVADPHTMSGEARIKLPFLYMTMDYDVNGQLLAVPLRSKGYFSGNFTDTKIYVKGTAKLVEKDGDKYFRVDKLSSKEVIGHGFIKLIAKNPSLQFAADLIANFYNDNPRRVMDAVNPIFVESSNDLFRSVLDQVLGSVPASEILPE